MSDTLARICAEKRVHIRESKRAAGSGEMAQRARQADPVRGFRKSLEAKRKDGFALIAEIKKASPSRGLIRADFNPANLAGAYETGGAACLSVLTDEPYFQGRDAYLPQARRACSLPVLRKDFMLDTYQVMEARALGADCILLILAALDDAQAAELEACAREHGMDVLAEVHDEAELERALSCLKTGLIGVNNRDLRTLAVDLATSERLAKAFANAGRADILCVCESGIATHDDLTRLEKSGYGCFLVGESLMRQDDVTLATRTLLGTV